MKVVFRADASARIGSGHVVRCAALAKRLQADGADVVFLSRALEGNMLDWLREQGLEVEALPALTGQSPDKAGDFGDWLEVPIEADIADCRQALLNAGRPDWLVVDHYALDILWEQALRSDVGRIMAIDDHDNRSHDVDLLLNQNLGADASHYAVRVPPECRLLIGPRYALLRPQFADARQVLHRDSGPLRRLLICFGGVDAGNITKLAIEAALAADIDGLQIDAVLGGGNPHKEMLGQEYAAHANVRIVSAVDNMAEVMAANDLFCGSGGGITWERAALGLPGLTIALAPNQKMACEAMALAGADLHLGDVGQVQLEDIAAAIRLLARSPRLLQAMSAEALAICDGNGAARISAKLSKRPIEIRLAELSDCDAVFEWRNQPSIRAMSGTTAPLDLAGHRQWFNATLANPDRVLLIGEQVATGGSTEPAGVVRFDIEGNVATISIYLVPGRQGSGLGSDMLAAAELWLAGHRPAIGSVVAHVLPANDVSRAMFVKAGYAPSLETMTKPLRPL